MEGTSKQHAVLSDCYKFLCEFCHPNCHSFAVAFGKSSGTNEFVMQYGEELTKRELGIMGGLVLSAGIFSALYNRVGEIVSTAWPPQQRPTVHPVTDGWQNAEPQEILPLNCLHEAQGRHPPHWVERSNTASALKEKLIRTNQPNFTASLY